MIGFGAGFQPKPDPGAALEIIRRTGVELREALYVGDSDVDILTGHNAGLPAMGALWGFRGEAELTAAGADALAAVPMDILEFARRG